ncbi:MAG: VOC family protein [Archangium sp.]|nr:VOC family protein [Archangium sp.]MDP3152110.1 VOC family protein [Archangium sp.]MDP3575008.1 VOC family protein [Archangium sp.]
MIDHLSLPVSDVDATCRTWAKALAPLGYSVLRRFTREQLPQLPYAQLAALGTKGKPDLWLRPAQQKVDYNHVAFVAQTRAEVDAFHKAALEAGMTDDGAPGLRQHYHPNYYGAFVRDADGHSLEVVCHAAVSVKKVVAKKKPAAVKKKQKVVAKKRR